MLTLSFRAAAAAWSTTIGGFLRLCVGRGDDHHQQRCWPNAASRDIVAGNMDRQTADVGRCTGDRIGRQNDLAVAEAHGRAVQADGRTAGHARRQGWAAGPAPALAALHCSVCRFSQGHLLNPAQAGFNQRVDIQAGFGRFGIVQRRDGFWDAWRQRRCSSLHRAGSMFQRCRCVGRSGWCHPCPCRSAAGKPAWLTT